MFQGHQINSPSLCLNPWFHSLLYIENKVQSLVSLHCVPLNEVWELEHQQTVGKNAVTAEMGHLVIGASFPGAIMLGTPFTF